jgi:hypothetical protein
VPPKQLDRRRLADIPDVHHGDALRSDRHCVNTELQQRLLQAKIVLNEIRRPQYRRRNTQILDHALDGVLAGKVRHVRVGVTLEHGEINNSFDVALASNTQRQHRLRQFIGNVGGEQE